MIDPPAGQGDVDEVLDQFLRPPVAFQHSCTTTRRLDTAMAGMPAWTLATAFFSPSTMTRNRRIGLDVGSHAEREVEAIPLTLAGASYLFFLPVSLSVRGSSNLSLDVLSELAVRRVVGEAEGWPHCLRGMRSQPSHSFSRRGSDSDLIRLARITRRYSLARRSARCFGEMSNGDPPGSLCSGP